MKLKDQLLQILDKSRAAELEFIASLTDEDRAYEGTYEKWSAKDIVAHMNYWQDVRCTRASRWVRGEELELILQGEQANMDCHERFSKSTWDEVETFAKQSHEKIVETLSNMDEEILAGPSVESDERKMWDSLVTAAYTHKLSHFSDFYQDRERSEAASLLWKEWARLVSPLDAGLEWQGLVYYNAACGLALAGDSKSAFEELRKGLELRPGLKAWSRRDPDLEILHDLPEYKEFFAPGFWWEALEANPQAEALADQFMRALSMLRIAVRAFTEEAWLEGETLYQRPAGLALHIAQANFTYSSLKPGERSEDPLMQISWGERDSSKLPSQEELQRFLDTVEMRLANFIAKSDFQAKEEQFPWTGFTVLSRALYTLRHIQHHLADMAMELQRRGLKPPDWQ